MSHFVLIVDPTFYIIHKTSGIREREDGKEEADR